MGENQLWPVRCRQSSAGWTCFFGGASGEAIGKPVKSEIINRDEGVQIVGVTWATPLTRDWIGVYALRSHTPLSIDEPLTRP